MTYKDRVAERIRTRTCIFANTQEGYRLHVFVGDDIHSLCNGRGVRKSNDARDRDPIETNRGPIEQQPYHCARCLKILNRAIGGAA